MADSYTTVNQVIIDACLGLVPSDTTLKNYVQFEKHARAWFMADYNPESGQTLKTVLLDVGPDRVASLPDDYLDFVVVGRQAGQYVRTLAHNPRLSPLPPVEPWCEREPLACAVSTAWPCYDYAGWEGGALCGYGWGEYREEFTIDLQERTLRLSSLIGTDEPLFLQYVSADLCPHKATPLHPYYALTLEYWCLWQWHLRKNELALASTYKNEYHAARRKARAQLSPFSLTDLQAIIQQSYNTIH